MKTIWELNQWLNYRLNRSESPRSTGLPWLPFSRDQRRQKLLPLVRPGGLILAHNMNRPTPDARFIEAITEDPALETAFLLMDGAGISVTLKKR